MELELTARTAFDKVGTRPVRPDGTDKVTGRALYGADLAKADMLVGKVLRSPHAHARILAIDISKAEALEGVKAVVTRDDFPDLAPDKTVKGEDEENLWDVARNVIARDKALYEGHAIAAVAATSAPVARKALRLIEVVWEVLPHVTDVDEAMDPDAPVLHEDMFTAGLDPRPQKPSNIAEYLKIEMGDIEAGFAEADVIVEREFRTEAAHQGYIEPHACIASASEDGLAELWCCTQGHFSVRSMCAAILGMDLSSLRVTSSEIGGGFGGKTTVFLEPLALALSKKSRRPVKMTMSREEVFRGSGPTSSTSMSVRIGATRDGRITACNATFKYQGGAFPGSPVSYGSVCGMAPYDCKNVVLDCYDVVVNRPKAAAYRAPGAPMAAFAVESVLDEVAQKTRSRSHQDAPRECREGGQQFGLRSGLRSDRIRRVPRGGALPSQSRCGTRTQPGQRHRCRILAELWRTDQCHGQRQHRRHRSRVARHSRYRREPCQHVSDGRRGARYRI